MPARALHRRRARLLRRGFYLLDRRFRRRKERYFTQAALAALTLAAVLLVKDALTNVAIVTAIASSAFIVFMTPNSRMALPRRVIGGHVAGVIVGLAIGVPLHDVAGKPFNDSLIVDVAAAFGVGVAMLVMAATDTEHPPAAGTVLGLILAPDPLQNGAIVLGAAAGLSAVRAICRPWLIDLAN
jgi:CBS-domain-containing membrane protein